MRKTKIICTIGPACNNEAVLTEMCLAGMNVARLNFSHGTHEEHKKNIELIRKVRETLDLPVAIMLDTKGPEYRIKTFENGKIVLKDGDSFALTTEDVQGNEQRVSVSYKNLIDDLSVGDVVLINNGLVKLSVEELSDTEAKCRVLCGGALTDRKSMNFPNKVLRNEYLSEQDKADLAFGVENGIDFVAASFVSRREDVQVLREYLDSLGGKEIEIIAKIENQAGVENLDGICEIADGVMVARGDLGVEIPFIRVPATQKYMIDRCQKLGKRVVTATEMLESMIEKPRPTRAEISDVANAVYDGTSAVMLSGESAAGKYPVESVRTMAEIAEYTESTIDYRRRFHDASYNIDTILESVSHAACTLASDVNAKCIVVSSISGTTAMKVSGFRSPVDIIGLTTSESAWRRLNLNWGVTPVLCGNLPSMEVLFYCAALEAKKKFQLSAGDNIVVTGGQNNGVSGSTDTVRVMRIS